MKRLSIEVSDALHRQAKLAAVEEGQTLSSLVIELLNAYLGKQAGAAHPRRRASDFQVSSPAHHLPEAAISA
jgi:hypothetical protein